MSAAFNGSEGTWNTTLAPTWIALVVRGNCDFQTKVQNAQNAGATYVIVFNNYPNAELVEMGPSASDGGTVTIGASFISLESYEALLPLLEANNGWVYMRIFNTGQTDNTAPWSAILFVAMLAFLISSFFILLFLALEYFRQRRRRRRLQRGIRWARRDRRCPCRYRSRAAGACHGHGRLWGGRVRDRVRYPDRPWRVTSEFARGHSGRGLTWRPGGTALGVASSGTLRHGR